MLSNCSQCQYFVHNPHHKGDRWIDVDSDCIEAIAFDESTSILKIRFNSGSIYEYYDFDRMKFSDFRNASSYGIFFNHQIKDIYDFSLSE